MPTLKLRVDPLALTPSGVSTQLLSLQAQYSSSTDINKARGDRHESSASISSQHAKPMQENKKLQAIVEACKRKLAEEHADKVWLWCSQQ